MVETKKIMVETTTKTVEIKKNKDEHQHKQSKDKNQHKHSLYVQKETLNYRQLWRSCKGIFTPNIGHYTSNTPTPSSLLFLEFLQKNKKIGSLDQNKVLGVYNDDFFYSTFLDIGCGNARNSMAFAKAGFKCRGIDISPEALEIAMKNAELNEVELDVTCTDFFNFKSEPFDVVFDSGCFHHLRTSEWNEYLLKLMAVSKVGSMFFLMGFSTKSRYYPGAMNEAQKYITRNWTLRSDHYSHFFVKEEIVSAFDGLFTLVHHYESDVEGTRGLVFHVCYFERK